MSFAPLLNTPAIVQIHAFVALALVAVTLILLSLPKGSVFHRTLGWAWVIGMGIVALSSFGINDMRVIGPFSPIHILSVITLVGLVYGVYAARSHNVAAHRRTMRSLSFWALGIAGAFTFFPGRVMFQVISGG
ncbi:MAG: DUF2306 domain-containing protein [Pseudomonadota bacterium]